VRLLARIFAVFSEVGATKSARLLRGRRRLERLERRAKEPRLERTVEDRDLVVARDEARTQRPVDVLARAEVDVVEPT
jgi:hypothetical protein